MKKQHSELRKTKLQCDQLIEKLERLTQSQGASVDMQWPVQNHKWWARCHCKVPRKTCLLGTAVYSSFEDGSIFQEIAEAWDDIHWWSDSAFNQSQKAYKYVHYHHNIHFESTPSSQLSTDVDEQLTDATSMNILKDWQKSVILEEMHITVSTTNTLHLDWFHRLWWGLAQIQASWSTSAMMDDEPLAKSMTFIVWRLFTSL